MMSNLFSSFDPSTSTSLSLNWLSMMMTMIMIPSLYWFTPSRITMSWILLTKKLNKEFKTILNSKLKSSTLIFISLFSFILYSNFLSLFPFVFSSTGHLTLTLTLALPMWMSFMLFGWINNTAHMFAHLVPQGTPPILMPFMVCIETISNIIRPGTLAIRLTANMIAGHLLMTLLGSTGLSLSTLFLSLMLLTQMLLLTLELAVSILQAYVFSVLSTLYSSEVI